jgi:hypothetical protein
VLFVTARSSKRSRCAPDQAGWWGRVFAALLFAFCVNYIPIHLASETHLDHWHAAVADTALHHDGHDDADHHDDSDHHTPHRASDHALTLTASAKAPTASAFIVVYLPAVASVLIYEPEPPPPIPLCERSRPPGESPPDPLQPRAPPLA